MPPSDFCAFSRCDHAVEGDVTYAQAIASDTFIDFYFKPKSAPLSKVFTHFEEFFWNHSFTTHKVGPEYAIYPETIISQREGYICRVILDRLDQIIDVMG